MSLWIFGYGSLLWRPGFPFEERRSAFVDGFERRLDQGSPDHRGTPERLGRVATLMASPGARCGGAVYRIADDAEPAILEALDVREQGGYDRLELDAVLVDAEPRTDARSIAAGRAVRAVTWIASVGNPYHLGPAPIDDMVAQIRAATGPSGRNLDYVLELDRALRALGHHDPHVAELVAALG